MAIGCGIAGTPAWAQPASISPDQARTSVQWLAGQMMRHVPEVIDGDDDWGDTKSIWAGVKVRRDGWKWKTHRRKKELSHGRWVKYDIRLPPLARTDETGRVVTDQLRIRSVTPVHSDPRISSVSTDATTLATTLGNTTDVSAWRIDAIANTPAEFSVRVERWNLGVQWYSVETTGTMSLSIQVQSTLSMQPDFSEVPPAMQLVVNVEAASLNIDRFEVQRISKIGGDVAEELGDLAEKTIGKIWLNKENDRLASRLNQAIDNNRDDLRWSMADWLAQLSR